MSVSNHRMPHRIDAIPVDSLPDTEAPSGDEAPITVKELRESPRTPGRYRIVLSNGAEYVVGLNALSDIGATRPGAQLSPSDVQRMQRSATVTVLVDRALRSLARGRRTRRELDLRLRRTEPDQSLVNEALDRLEQSGAIADDEAARAEASSRLRRGEAPGRVRQTLRRKGITAAQTNIAIAQAIEADGFDELEACRVQGLKRWRSLASLEAVVARRRLIGYLQRRGFSSQHVRTVVAELQKN